MGKFVLRCILFDCSSNETCSDLWLRMMRHTKIQTTVIIIIVIITTTTINANDSADVIMPPSWSEIVGEGIVVPFEGSVVAIAVGRFAPSVLEFVAIVEEFLMWVCVG